MSVYILWHSQLCICTALKQPLAKLYMHIYTYIHIFTMGWGVSICFFTHAWENGQYGAFLFLRLMSPLIATSVSIWSSTETLPNITMCFSVNLLLNRFLVLFARINGFSRLLLPIILTIHTLEHLIWYERDFHDSRTDWAFNLTSVTSIKGFCQLLDLETKHEPFCFVYFTVG